MAPAGSSSDFFNSIGQYPTFGKAPLPVVAAGAAHSGKRDVWFGWKTDIATKAVWGYPPIVRTRAQKLRRWTEDRHHLIRRFAFELVIVVVGVTAAFALENARQDREEAEYRVQMVRALSESLDDYAGHGVEVQRHIDRLLREFDLARQQKLQPTPPVYRESGGERPPTRAWDASAESGAARALDPKLFFRLARFHGRADSIGDRYLRYNDFSEQRVLPYVREPGTFYDEGGQLKPEYAGYVDRLRDLQREHIALLTEAGKLRDALR